MLVSNLAPFLKWPGGKKWLVSRLIDIIPNTYRNYYEPFIGGGAIYLRLAPPKAVISDINSELINLYIVMRDNPDQLIRELIRHQEQHDTEYYYEIRSQEPTDAIIKAGHFLYLNRACYNGMYRVNKQGKFNVPVGRKSNFIYDIDKFNNYSHALKKAVILNSDFGQIIQKAGNLDLVFADPPYTIAHNQNSFIKYNEKLFSWLDQERLLKELYSAKERGAIIISTNANYKEIYEMYADNGFYISVMERYCSIAGQPSKRSITEELLITSFPIDFD